MWVFISYVALVAASLAGLYWQFCHIMAIAGADMLWLPSLYRDISAGHFSIFYWCLPTSRYIFPDLPLHIFFQWLSGDTFIALFLHIVSYYALAFLLLGHILHLVCGLAWERIRLPLLLALTLSVLPGVLPVGTTFGAFFPSYHGSNTILTLLGFLLLIRYLHQPSLIRVFLLVFVGWAGGFSEALFFVSFVAPMLLCIMFYRGLLWRQRAVGVYVWLASLLGSWMAERLVPASQLQFAHHFVQTPGQILGHIWRFLHDLTQPTGLLVAIFIILAIIIAVRNYRLVAINRGIGLGVLALVAVPIFSSFLIGKYVDISSSRYFALSFIVPVAIVVFYTFTRVRIWLWAIFSVVLLGYAGMAQGYVSLSQLRYPPVVQTIDTLATDLGLRAGLGQYWIARPIEILSRRGLRVADLSTNGYLYLKTCSIGWLGLPYTPAPALYYNYIIMHDIDPDGVLRLYGRPSRVYPIQFGSISTQLWIYPYDLGTRLATDRFLMDILMIRLREHRYMLSPIEFAHIVNGIVDVLAKAEPQPALPAGY